MSSMRGRSMAMEPSGDSRRALVKWLEGVDEGTFTPDVQLGWITNFDAACPCFPDTYGIEWRVGPKPKAGWPVIEALVLDVSSDIEYLKSKADNLERLANVATPTRSNSSLMDVNSQAFKDLVNRLSKHQPLEPLRTPRREVEQSSSSPPPQEKVCIGKSLCIDKTVHTLVLSASSPGRMIRPLLRQAFSRRRLIASSYAGQKRVINGEVRVKPALKKYQKMADIQAVVLKKFPHFSQASFGAAVNNFLGERPNAIHTVEYVDESDSEAE